MNRSRGAGQPPAARFSNQWDLPGPSKQFPAPPDTGQGAMELLQAMTGPRFVSKDLEAVRDPEIPGVWLVLDRENKKGHIVYVNDQDFETVNSYEDAEKEFQRAARRGAPSSFKKVSEPRDPRDLIRKPNSNLADYVDGYDYGETADPIEAAIDQVLEAQNPDVGEVASEVIAQLKLDKKGKAVSAKVLWDYIDSALAFLPVSQRVPLKNAVVAHIRANKLIRIL